MHLKKPVAFIPILAAVCMASLCAHAKAQEEPESIPPRIAQAGARKQSPVMNLLVISAVFGAGTHFADVTCRVNYLLCQSDAGFCANPPALGGDPIPYTRKALVIVYEFRGARHIFTADETGAVSLDILRSAAKKKK